MIKYLAVFILLASGYLIYTNFPESHGPGITAKEQPKLNRLTWQKPFTFKGATLTPTKLINAEVRIIKRKRYYFDDFSKYSPVDALIGWNELSDERNLDHIYFSLGNRKFELDLTRPPLEVPKIYAESDLWHLIPSTSDIDEKVKTLRNGNIIHLKGMIVNLSNETNFDFISASEINQKNRNASFSVWIEDFQIR
ncbi:MAG: hypothetical protein WD059_09460 [Balneolaceae bacterium]